MEVLHAPPLLHELPGQPVEQLRMGWDLALTSKIARSPDEAASEMMLPDAVHPDPGREGILRGNNPVGEGESTSQRLAGGRRHDPRLRRIQHLQEGRFDRISWTAGIAAGQHPGLGRLRPGLAHHQRLGRCRTRRLQSTENHLVRVPAIPVGRHIVEEREERVVVALADRIDLVVVATGAVDRQPEEHLPRRGDKVIQLVVPRELPVSRLVVPDPKPVVTCCDARLVIGIRQLIAGELLPYEAVEGLVGVERADDVVTVAPGVGLGPIALVAVGLGEADEIEPVPPPLLTVVG